MEIPKKVKLIQLAGEIAIPLLGYFWWSWSFYFLLLFYLLDLIANTVLLYYKIKKIEAYTGKKTEGVFFFTLKTLSLLFGIIGLGAGLISQQNPDFDFWEQTLRFVMLKDMGLPQGIFLIPIVIYAAYLNYKMSFLLTQQFRVASVDQVRNNHSKAMYLVLAGLGLGFGISCFYIVPEMISVFVTVIAIGLYSYFYKK